MLVASYRTADIEVASIVPALYVGVQTETAMSVEQISGGLAVHGVHALVGLSQKSCKKAPRHVTHLLLLPEWRRVHLEAILVKNGLSAKVVF